MRFDRFQLLDHPELTVAILMLIFLAVRCTLNWLWRWLIPARRVRIRSVDFGHDVQSAVAGLPIEWARSSRKEESRCTGVRKDDDLTPRPSDPAPEPEHDVRQAQQHAGFEELPLALEPIPEAVGLDGNMDQYVAP